MNTPTIDTITKPSLTEYDETLLTNSIKMLLKGLQSGVLNLNDFGIHFHRLLRNYKDPPFEFLCFYLAIKYRFLIHIDHPIYVASDMFYWSSWLSTPCNALTKVAAIAPIIPVLYKSCVGLSKADVRLREIGCLLKRIVDYIILYGSLEDQRKEIEKLSYCFKDMMQVWTMDQVESDCEPLYHLRIFFPLLSDEVRLQISACYRTDYLAAVVMVEMLLLMLQFKLRFGVCGVDQRMDITTWVVQTLEEFKNLTFYDMLLRMMLEPSLPVTALLSSEEEILLRRVLYNAVLLGELPFLRSGRFDQLHENHLKNMFLAWLLVADNAIEFEREYEAGERATTVSYTEAFSRSDIPNLLIKLVDNQMIQIGMKEKLSRPNTPTPKALIEWLLGLQDLGVRVFEDSSTLHAKATMCSLRQDYGLLEWKPAVNLTSTHGRRKRYEEMGAEEPQAKFVKCESHNSPVTSISLHPAFGDALISGSQGNTTVNGLCTEYEKEKTTPIDADEEMEDVD